MQCSAVSFLGGPAFSSVRTHLFLSIAAIRTAKCIFGFSGAPPQNRKRPKNRILEQSPFNQRFDWSDECEGLIEVNLVSRSGEINGRR